MNIMLEIIENAPQNEVIFYLNSNFNTREIKLTSLFFRPIQNVRSSSQFTSFSQGHKNVRRRLRAMHIVKNI